MFHFDESKYFPINIEIIRRSGVAPCDCFLLLKANDHLIPFLKQDQPIPISKLRKIHSKEEKCMYAEIQNKDKYTQYLSKLFTTDDGKDLLNFLIEQNKGIDIFGIPADFDFYEYLKDSKQHADLVKPPEAKKQEILELKNGTVTFLESQTEKIKNVFNGKDEEALQKFQINHEVQSIISALQKINESNKPVLSRDINVINNATEYIQTRMTILSKKLQNLDPELAQKISNSLNKASENLAAINKLKSEGKHLDQFMDLKKYSFALETHLRVIGKRSAESCDSFNQLIQETMSTVSDSGSKILLATGAINQTDKEIDKEKDDLILKLSKLVRKQAEIIGKLKAGQKTLNANYVKLKDSIGTIADVNYQALVANPLDQMGQTFQFMQQRVHDLGQISLDMDHKFNTSNIMHIIQPGLTVDDLKSIDVTTPEIPATKSVQEIISSYEESAHAEILPPTQVGSTSSVMPPAASDLPMPALAQATQNPAPANTTTIVYQQKPAAPAAATVEAIPTKETVPVEEKEVPQEMPTPSVQLEEIIKHLGSENTDLIKAVKLLDADRAKIFNILANEKRNLQKLTSQFAEEKHKVKDISGKLLERDLKLKEVQTQLNNIKTQLRVETQKKEEAELHAQKLAEEDKHNKLEIAKLRMKPTKAS